MTMGTASLNSSASLSRSPHRQMSGLHQNSSQTSHHLRHNVAASQQGPSQDSLPSLTGNQPDIATMEPGE